MSENRLEKICWYLIKKNIKRTTLGYRYLIDSIRIMLEGDMRENRKITNVYRQVAELNCTSSNCVERDIRHTIRGSNQTCKEFIFQAMNDIRFMF